MRKFDYSAFLGALLTPEISNLLSAIHEYRGKLSFFSFSHNMSEANALYF